MTPVLLGLHRPPERFRQPRREGDRERSSKPALLHALEAMRLPFSAWYEAVPTLDAASSERAATARTLLSPLELNDSARYRSPKRRAEYLAGRIAAKRAVARALGQTSCSGFDIVRQANGAPVVKQRPDLKVSISHSADWALAAVSSRPMGIDLELETPRAQALTRWFFSPGELQLLETKAGSDWHGLVNLLWTRKEAAAKVGHWGSNLPFSQLDCRHPRLCIGSMLLRLKSRRCDGYLVSIAYQECPEDALGEFYG